jgi:hypothetical protein
MDDVFETLPPEGQQTNPGEAQPPAQQPPEPQEQPPSPPPEEPGTAAPPAAGTDRQVPLDALEAVRGERNDWKGKATEAQTEARMLREQLQRFQQGQQGQQGQPQQIDPMQAQVQRMENVVLNASERAARRDHGTETVDKAWQRVQQEFSQNPALYQQIVGSPDPWDAVVQQGKRLLAMDEIGTDPEAFRKKVEERVRAELAANPLATPAAAPAAPNLPQSLAGARSAGARGTTFTGPTPMENLFNN